jgi:uncharacterized protein YyaL (SSP411 family)
MGRLILVLSVVLVAITLTAAAQPADAKAGPANRLAKESSPYLLQHSHNPVDWYPWGPEAFAKAQKENKLIFLSIGYSSCHWCHVMERESFTNADVAKILNGSFVCIKVDREERPDIDQIYMTALQAFGKSGGWPLSMFLTPDGKPIVGGTYWPPDDRNIDGQTVRGFKFVLNKMIDLEKERPKELRDQADKVANMTAQALERAGRSVVGPEPTAALVTVAVDALKGEFDPQHGGFGNPLVDFKGTKFPVPPYLELLLQVGQRTKSEEMLGMVWRTLDHMARGGIYDQVGGGFHRYSTERTWTVPHFEKMLYDNAQLVEVYARAFRLTSNPLYRRMVEETLTFVRRELTSPEGAFYAALDADADAEEGRFYVWTKAELDAALPDPAENALARQVFGLGDGPNFEGKYFILTRPDGVKDAADVRVSEFKQRFFDARAKRPRPFLDTKVLTAWNGQMIAAYAVAGRLLNEPRYLEAAATAADFVLNHLRTADGRLLRTYGAAPGELARAKFAAYLDDYAFLAHGLLCLHDATGTARWLTEARALTDAMIRDHGDPAGGFFYTAADHEKLFARAKDQHDGAQPSGNSAAVRNLVRLAAKTGDARYRDLAGKALKAFASALEQNPANLTLMAAALDEFLVGAPAPVAPAPQLADQPAGGGAKRSDAVVKATATADKPGADGKQAVKITLAIEKNWHLYANPVGNEGLESSQITVSVTGKAKPQSVKIEYPKGKVVKDPLVGDYLVYEGTVEIKAAVQRAGGDTGPLEVSIKLQACDEKTCLLPATIKLTVP